jgi:hypothetical protein
MKGYVSKWDQAKIRAASQYKFLDNESQILNVARQIMAKLIVGKTTTIGNINGKLVLNKEKVLKKPILP